MLMERAITGGTSRAPVFKFEELILAIGKFGGAATDLLIAVLQNRDAECVETGGERDGCGAGYAAELLGEMRFGPATNALLDRLSDPSSAVRGKAAQALGKIRAVGAVELLTAVLADRNEFVRAQVAEALGKIGDSKATAPLQAMLNDQSAVVRDAVARALNLLCWKPTTASDSAALAAANQDFETAAKQGIEAIRPILWAVWDAYGVKNKQTNDAVGMGRHLANLMKSKERELLPDREEIKPMIDALESIVVHRQLTAQRRDVEMLANLPDLRVKYTAEIVRVNEGSGYEYVDEVLSETNYSCAALRDRAASSS
jgi:HEAT repeat protein